MEKRPQTLESCPDEHPSVQAMEVAKRLATPMQIGHLTVPNRIWVAPMAGVTDRPFRRLCRELGAGHAVSEMAASNPQLWESMKTTRRTNHDGEPGPIAVQIVGANPEFMAQSAVYNIEKGAQIIDINMGCPAKKVCGAYGGSALMKDESLVQSILEAVVQACAPYDVPVTLKMRTGWDLEHKNAPVIAQIAQDIGIAALTIHGRTRACRYKGHAEYDTIKAIKAAISIPVIANGDIADTTKAVEVFHFTQADGIMIGRSAQGNPWIFREILHYVDTGTPCAAPSYAEMQSVLLRHLEDHYAFYGERLGVTTARKHIIWYVQNLPDSKAFCQLMNRQTTTAEQYKAVQSWFSRYV